MDHLTIRQKESSIQASLAVANLGKVKSKRLGVAGNIQFKKKTGQAGFASHVIQMCGEEEIQEARQAAANVHTLSADQVEAWRQRIERWLGEENIFSPRRRLFEELYHAFSRQGLARQFNQPHLMTRILAPQQLVRPDIGTHSVRTSSGSMERNLGGALVPRGSGSSDMGMLLSFMRRGGGAGLQGFHRHPLENLDQVYNILQRLHAQRSASEGSKFAMVAVDRRQLTQEHVFDLNDPGVTKMFMEAYHRFRAMYQNLQEEDVVAVKGSVDGEAIKGLRAFKGVPEKETLEKIIQLLLDMASAEPDPVYKPFRKGPDDDQGPGPDDGGLMA